MSLSGHLCLFTIVGLLLPTTGQTQPVTTPISRADSTPVNTRVLTSPVHPELQPVPLTPTPQADEASPPPPETQTQQPTSMDVHLTAGPGTDKSSTEADPTKGITLSQKPPGKAFATDPDLRPAGHSSHHTPFFSLQTRPLSGNTACWSQLCYSSQALSSSPVASVGSFPSYAGIIIGEPAGSGGRRPDEHLRLSPHQLTVPASSVPSQSLPNSD
ncbi:FXYD domain-containing ion transport regulator 5 isoform 3-T3 [Hipposideros larvatus]